MKITKEYYTGSYYFYRESFVSRFYSRSICKKFVEAVLQISHTPEKIKVTFNTKNPKKKGFRKVKRTGMWEVKIGNSFHDLTTLQKNALYDANVGFGDSFWVKIEKVP